MRLGILWLILFVMFIAEGALFPWFVPSSWAAEVDIAPRAVMVGIVFTALYFNRHAALFFGLMLGLMHSIVYSAHMIGPHAFSLGLIGYAIGLIFYGRNVNVFNAVFVVLLSSIFYELAIYQTLSLFRLIDVPFQWFALRHVVPNMLLNALLALIIYVPLRRFSERTALKRDKEELEA